MADIENEIRKLIDSGDIGVNWDGPRQTRLWNGKLPAQYDKDAMQYPTNDPTNVTSKKQTLRRYPGVRTDPRYAERYKDQDT
jgi:hypothetical protein